MSLREKRVRTRRAVARDYSFGLCEHTVSAVLYMHTALMRDKRVSKHLRIFLRSHVSDLVFIFFPGAAFPGGTQRVQRFRSRDISH